MPVFVSLNSFNAGELSPKMLGRFDVSQYTKGCQTCCNFMVTPYGAVERRPGTVLVAPAKYQSHRVRLIRFVYSSDIAYLCEVGDLYIRFYRNGVLVDEVSTNFIENELADLKVVQSADVMFVIAPDHPVQELKRLAEAEFSIGEMTFEYPPVLDPNITETSITPSAAGGDITLTASAAVFAAGNVGGYWELIHTRHANDVSIDFTADGTSATLEVVGYWSLTTHGTWSGTLKLQRSFDAGSTWADYRTYTSSADNNVSTSGEEDGEDVVYRLKMESYVASTTGTLKLCRCLLSNPDYVTTGVVKITSVTDSTHAAGTVVKKLGGTTATKEWNEGAWSVRRGFPRSIAFF